MSEQEILQQLQKQMDDLAMETHSPVEEALRSAISVLISILRQKYGEA